MTLLLAWPLLLVAPIASACPGQMEREAEPDRTERPSDGERAARPSDGELAERPPDEFRVEERPIAERDIALRPEADPAVCLRGEPFVAEGAVPVARVAADAGDGGPAAGADAPHQVAALRWQPHDGCERFVIDIVDENGDPAATPGDVSVELLRELGVLRVSLRDVRWVDPDATDARFQGPLARAAYSVWSPEGEWTFVDLHLARSAEAHVASLEDPARVVVDLRPGGGRIPDPPASDRLVVVLEPRPGEASYPLTVTGYARAFEANVIARIEQEGRQVEEAFTTATAWVDAWGHYSFTFDEGPTGPIELHVGEYSAEDGTWEGTAVRLDMR